MYRALRLCSQGGAFEAIPDLPRIVDLAQLRASLETAGIPVLDARVLLIASLPPEVTVTRAGRLLFKTGDEQVARRAFERLMEFRAIAEAPAAPSPRTTR